MESHVVIGIVALTIICPYTICAYIFECPMKAIVYVWAGDLVSVSFYNNAIEILDLIVNKGPTCTSASTI